jgi:hypothetical protein
LLLLGKVAKENFPVSLCTLFSLARDCLFFNDAVADVLQQLEDLDNVLVVELGGELCERGDQWLEERSVLVLVVSKLVEDLVVARLDLCESNTVDDVVDELNTFLECGDGDGVLVVLLLICEMIEHLMG